MRRTQDGMTILAVFLLTASVSQGQTGPAKKAYMFHGMVEAVPVDTQSLQANGEKVEGWMR